MADRVERRGRADLVAGLAHDFEDGVTARPLRVIPCEHIAITELMLQSPPEQPLHCPPAVTQVHLHHGGRAPTGSSPTTRHARNPRTSISHRTTLFGTAAMPTTSGPPAD